MHERAPVREMILGLAAVVVQHDALVEQPRGQHRGHRREQERRVRRGEDVRHVIARQPRQAGHIQQLVQRGPRVRQPAHPSHAEWKPWIDRDERRIHSVFTERAARAPAPGLPAPRESRGSPRQRRHASRSRLRAFERDVEEAPAPQLERQHRPELQIEIAAALRSAAAAARRSRRRRSRAGGRCPTAAGRARIRAGRRGTTRASGTAKPCFCRSMMSSGRMPRIACLNRYFVVPSRSRRCAGIVAANSTSRWSSSGGRASIECAIVMRSTFVRMSSGRYVCRSRYCAADSQSRPSSARCDERSAQRIVPRDVLEGARAGTAARISSARNSVDASR